MIMIEIEHQKLLRSYLGRIVAIPDQEWKRLSSSIGHRRLVKDDYFVKAGENANHIGFVLNGLLKKFYRTEDGREFIKDFSVEGRLVTAYSSLLQNTPVRLNIQAIEATNLLVIPYDKFTSLYQWHPCWQRLGRKIAENLFIEREQREWELLIFPAKERYEMFVQRYPDLLARVPQYEIASYLGISPISLSRLRGEKQRVGLKKEFLSPRQ
jgi:CRP-like cAMP-binding protein